MTFSMLMYALMACTCAWLVVALVVERVRPPVLTMRNVHLPARAQQLGRLRVQQSHFCAGSGDARSVAIHPRKLTERRRRDCRRPGRVRHS